MPTEMTTLCFHTRDAVERDDSRLTFDLPSERLRTAAVKVALASCEFPLVQWTVEEDWNRLWLCEGVCLQGEARTLQVVAQAADAPEEETVMEPVAIVLPPRLNAVVSVRAGADGTTVCECAVAHGLWGAATGARLPTARGGGGGARIVGARTGDVSLADAAYVSPTAFALSAGDVVGPSDVATSGALHVFTPPPPSPAHLCEWLTAAARGALAAHGVTLAFAYDAASDRVLVRATSDAPGARLRVLPGPLARLLGLSTAPLRLRAERGLSAGGGGGAVLPSEPTALWDYVEVPPGFYAPCHRPMCTGQPLRFGAELEAAVNRLYFPLAGADRLPPGASTPHALVFTEPGGRTVTCSVPCGRFGAPALLAAYLEAEMTTVAASVTPGVSFSVAHEDERYVFACERRDPTSGRVAPARFGLLFHHPLSLDPARLGFAAQPLAGEHTYVAPERTRAPVASNVLRVSEMGAQKRFRLHATHPPPMIAVVHGLEGGALRLRTYVNRLPFAHGFRTGDVVRLSASGDAPYVDATGEEREASATTARVPLECSCVVDVAAAGDAADPCVLRLRAPSLAGLADPGTCVQVACDVVPWNVCFAKPRSLPAALVGFPERAVLWGRDGSVRDADGAALPPYEAPNVHCLDHPDAIMVTFSEQGGTGLEHTYRGETKHIFAKVVAYPLLREERLLPRDTLLQRDQMSRFTIAFWNPDLRTPYRFHGAEFTFALYLLSVV